MKVRVDQELCIACGLCIDNVPEVFEWGAEGTSVAKVDMVPGELEQAVREAAADCPTEAIMVEE
ncbi:ferredoxin [Clostridiales bacterium PH28_bin88]|nr:ferredoxin [Clostridiales bacterium PH28_bin88]